jgi:tRNA dimethylallyltransferase
MEIISADSRQVYKGLDIGTGKDKSVPQYMIDVEKCKMQNAKCKIIEEHLLYSVAQYRDQALKIINDIWSRGKIPLVVGGTGFYIDSLIYEQNTNSTPPNAKVREKLSKLKNAELLKIINNIDSITYNKIDHNNRARLIRAAEIVTITKKPIEQLESTIRDGWLVDLYVLDLPREELYRRIDKRVDDRIKEGMIEEVEGLIRSGVSVEWLMSLGLEYKFITEFLMQNAECRMQNGGNYHNNNSKIENWNLDSENYADMIQRLKFAIHAYSRRQNTYFKKWSNAQWLSGREIAARVDKISGV